MFIVYGIVICVLNALWMLLNVLGLPGNWLMVGTTAIAAYLMRDQNVFHIGTLVTIVGLAILAEVLEFMLGAAGAAKHGSTRRGALGAIIGAMIGGIAGTVLIPIPIIGSIIGACLGAFAGALGLELTGGKKIGHALKVGQGAAVGRLWGTVAKITVGGAIWAIVAVAAFVP